MFQSLGGVIVVILLALAIFFVVIYLFFNSNTLFGVALQRIAWAVAMRNVFESSLRRWNRFADTNDCKNYSYRISFLGVFSGDGPRGRSSIWWDSPFGIILLRDNKDVACIGFNIVTKEKSVIVAQIQGVRGKSQYLKNIRWERMLLECVVASAKFLRFREVVVVPALRNRWCKNDQKYSPERFKQFQLRYDVTAKRSGFSWDQERELYYLSIDTIARE